MPKIKLHNEVVVLRNHQRYNYNRDKYLGKEGIVYWKRRGKYKVKFYDEELEQSRRDRFVWKASELRLRCYKYGEAIEEVGRVNLILFDNSTPKEAGHETSRSDTRSTTEERT